MKNLILCTIPTSIIYLSFLITIIILLIKHTNKTIIIASILFIMLLCAIPFIMPFYKDIIEKETKSFEGEYVVYNSSSGLLMASENGFKDENRTLYVYVFNFQYSKYNLEKGNRYKVTYYKNSHAVYSIELIE